MKFIETEIKNKFYKPGLGEKPRTRAIINLDTVSHIKENNNGKAEFQFGQGYLATIENYDDILSQLDVQSWLKEDEETIYRRVQHEYLLADAEYHLADYFSVDDIYNLEEADKVVANKCNGITFSELIDKTDKNYILEDIVNRYEKSKDSVTP